MQFNHATQQITPGVRTVNKLHRRNESSSDTLNNHHKKITPAQDQKEDECCIADPCTSSLIFAIN